jgi:hypothetical protein
VEKLLFGDFNAMVEFFISPSFEGAYGFRVFRCKDSLQICYTLETKRISNLDTVEKMMSKEFPSRGLKADRKFSQEEMSENAKYNREMFEKRHKESLRLYKTTNQSVSVNYLFAEKLYGIVASTIDNFTGKGRPAVIMDGYTVTFRCVVGDEVWTLTVHCPQGEILRLVDICKQIVKDIEMNDFKEMKYIVLFENDFLKGTSK